MPSILPIRHQRDLPLDKLILAEAPGAEAIEMDVLFVGAGPAGLAGAIELARLAKAEQAAGGGWASSTSACSRRPGLGEHNLSGAVVNPRAFRELFPDLDRRRLPVPPAGGRGSGVLPDRGRRRGASPRRPRCTTTGNYVASICEIVRWLGEQGGGARRERVHRLPGGLAARRGRARCAACARRPAASTATDTPGAASRRPPTSPRRSPCSRRAPAAPSPRPGAQWQGVVVRQPADLRARRQGTLEGDPAARRA